jgi:hypothetical protein
MSEFARLKARPATRIHSTRTHSSSQNQSASPRSFIGNQAMQRLLQREAAEEQKPVTFAEFQSSVVQATNTLGGAITPDYVGRSGDDHFMVAVLKVGKRSHRLMPTTDAQMVSMKEGKTKSGTIEGAAQLVYISLQSLPGRSRVTCKVVEVETSVVQSAAKHDFDPSPQGMTDAVMHALVKMGVPWTQSKEPYTGSVSDM